MKMPMPAKYLVSEYDVLCCARSGKVILKHGKKRKPPINGGL